jgi:hypothetical protein
MMRCEVVIRTALGLLIETQVEVERSCDAIGWAADRLGIELD